MFGKVALHGIGAGVAWAAFTVQGLVVYLVLLAYAVGEDLDTGGPLAGPFLVLIAAVVGAVLVPLLFVPSMALGAVGRRGPAARFAITAGTAALLAAVYVAGVSVATDVPAADAVVAWLIGLLALPGPLGAYAAVVHGGQAIWRRLSRSEPQAVPGIDVGTP